MIKVWADAAEAGLLDRYGERGSAFAYLPDIPPQRAVSVTMPLRLPSWNASFGLAPIFEMNLPEGFLKERLRLAFAKATGQFDDFDLLAIVGHSQIGRLRYTGQREPLEENVPFQSVHEILERGRGGELFRYLIEKFATFSGVSGVQPKVLVRDESASAVIQGAQPRLSQSWRGATHIVKFWEANEYPQLAANEYFCLRVAQQCGLPVPPFHLAQDALALVVDRFDLRSDGGYCGFEDFCVLNAKRTDQKYSGSYETSVMKRFLQFGKSPKQAEDLKNLFTLIVINCALRNGDAHLKNFGIIYDDVLGQARLAPVYDLVTTTVYLPKDSMALTLNGTTQWPGAKELRKLGETRIAGMATEVNHVLERVADSMSHAAAEIRSYIKEHPEFATIGKAMLQEWEKGRKLSLKLA